MTDLEIKNFEKKLDSQYSSKTSFAALKRIIDEYVDSNRIDYISSGSSRFVVKISNTKVLKIAKNKKGLRQNETEADWGLKNYGVAAEWFDESDEHIWIESELCTKAKTKDFKDKYDYTFKYFCSCIEYCFYEIHPSRYYKPYKPENYDKIWDDDKYAFIQNICNYIADFDVPVGDLLRINNYGINQNSDIVLVDTGLSNDVLNEYYR